VGLGDLSGSDRCPNEGTAVDRGGLRLPGQTPSRGFGLGHPRPVEGNVGTAAKTLDPVPFGLPVPHEDDSGHS